MKINRRKDEDLSMASSFNGPALTLEHLEGYSLCAMWTESVAALTGTFKLQATNEAFKQRGWDNEENTDTVWADIPGSEVAVSGDGSFLWNVSDAYYGAVRLVYTTTTGEGTVTAEWLCKSAV